MSAALTAEAPAVNQQTLDVLHAQVMQRIWAETDLGLYRHPYRPLDDALFHVKRGFTPWGAVSPRPAETIALMAADLEKLLTVPGAVIRQMVRQQSYNSGCRSPWVEAQQRQDVTTQQLQAHRGTLHPRMQPSELVAQFASRGVMIQAHDGTLHVTPAEALSEADRTVLRENKAGILAALEGAAVVI